MAESLGDETAVGRESLPDSRKRGFHRFLARCRHPMPLTIETILQAAEKGHLDNTFLADWYTIYYDPAWQEILRLCRDLTEAGYLQAEFDEHFDKAPIFLKGKARITIPGRDYLERVRQGKLWRHFVTWVIVFLGGLLTAFISMWLNLLVEVYAKAHGLK